MDIGLNRLNVTLSNAVLRILRALARVLLRHGMPFHWFVDLAKRAYVDVAMAEFGIPGRRPSISRVSLLTGLTRKEVQRLSDSATSLDTESIERHNRASRVVMGWVRDADFHGADRAPAALSFDEGTISFAQLVRRYGGDVPPRAVLDELLRVGTADRLPDGRVRLLARVYIPRTSDLGKLAILGTDVSDLIDTIDRNLQAGAEPSRFQRTVVYDNLPVQAMAEFRALSTMHAQELIELLDVWLSQHDRDVNPLVRGTGRIRAGMGIFYFEQDLGDSQGVGQ